MIRKAFDRLFFEHDVFDRPDDYNREFDPVKIIVFGDNADHLKFFVYHGKSRIISK